jgi:hypothetical protein
MLHGKRAACKRRGPSLTLCFDERRVRAASFFIMVGQDAVGEWTCVVLEPMRLELRLASQPQVLGHSLFLATYLLWPVHKNVYYGYEQRFINE